MAEKKTLKELREDIVSLEKLHKEEAKKLQEAQAKFLEDEKKLVEGLRKRIANLFKGVEVEVDTNEYRCEVKLGCLSLVRYTYGNFKFTNVNRKTANKVVEMFEEVYGEVKEASDPVPCGCGTLTYTDPYAKPYWAYLGDTHCSTSVSLGTTGVATLTSGIDSITTNTY